MPRPPAGDGQRDTGPALRGARAALIAIVGPTGSGKSETAIAVAEALDGEIVGCDAIQVYRDFDVASAKPTEADRARVPHHVVDHVDPRRDYSLADYVADAEQAIATIVERRRVPVVVGGTGLYLRGLLRGIIPAPARDAELRTRLRRMADRFGAPRLHRWLAAADPRAAARIGPRDLQRIVRGLEIALSGEASWSRRIDEDGTWADGGERYRCLKVGLRLEAGRLGAALEHRVEAFFAAGLVDEVRRLRAAGVPATANAFKAIGYREVLAALEGGGDPAACVAEVALRTRQYAKRQRTWFRGEPGLRWVEAAESVATRRERIVGWWRAMQKR